MVTCTQAIVDKAHQAKAKVVVATDLLALTQLAPPGEWGADICIGTAQRFGVPMGYGGPHAAFLACHDEYKRLMPGRIIGAASQPLDTLIAGSSGGSQGNLKPPCESLFTAHGCLLACPQARNHLLDCRVLRIQLQGPSQSRDRPRLTGCCRCCLSIAAASDCCCWRTTAADGAALGCRHWPLTRRLHAGQEGLLQHSYHGVLTVWIVWCRREPGRAGQAGAAHGNADARAAHPPGQGHQQHLHRAGMRAAPMWTLATYMLLCMRPQPSLYGITVTHQLEPHAPHTCRTLDLC